MRAFKGAKEGFIVSFGKQQEQRRRVSQSRQLKREKRSSQGSYHLLFLRLPSFLLLLPFGYLQTYLRRLPSFHLVEGNLAVGRTSVVQRILAVSVHQEEHSISP